MVFNEDQLKQIHDEFHLNVQTVKERADKVDYEKLFQEEIPGEAVDLREFYRKYKEKDQTKEFNIEEIKARAFRAYEKCRDLVPDKKHLSVWEMVDPSFKKPQNLN